MESATQPNARWSWGHLRQMLWQLAEQGAGPIDGARSLVARAQKKWPEASEQQQVARLLRGEARKQFTAALALAAVSSVALPAGLPASLAAAYLLEARLAMAIALLLGHALDAPGVREALEEALSRPALEGGPAPQADSAPPAEHGRTPPPPNGPAGDQSVLEQALLNARLIVDYAAPRALAQGRALLLRHASKRWQRRLLPVVRALPAAGQVVVAGFEARAMRSLAMRVEERLSRLPTESTRSRAMAARLV